MPIICDMAQKAPKGLPSRTVQISSIRQQKLLECWHFDEKTIIS